MYPPTRDLASTSHTISGQEYGNGIYNTNQSTYHSGGWRAYSAFKDTDHVGYHAVANQYTSSGVYNKNNYIVNDYLGDWITIHMPIKIKLTKYGFNPRAANHMSRVPGQYKIYGSNDGINWIELVHKTTRISYTLTITTSSGDTTSYFEESVLIDDEYNRFALVVNKLYGNDSVLNFNEWYIYGKEKI